MDASVNRIPPSKDERALILALKLDGTSRSAVEFSLEELNMLIKTAGAVTVESRIVSREQIHPSYIVGKGFLGEIKDLISEKDIKLIVFDLNNIRPAQVRNLEEALKCRIVGRTEIILDIFARRARSSEAKIQVELAQLNYILPRLKGLGGVLSRLGGGIGTRGPGEKMLETDRRHIIRRITSLKNKLEKIHAHRERTRSFRKKEVLGAVVGYTNAGKSTLINSLAKDDLFVEDRLFATLDSYTRKVFIEQGKQVLLTDTVGFIRNLPSHLIESFRSTLDEIQNADFILHVVDLTSPDIETNIQTVERELNSLGSFDKPTILFFNKIDLLKGDTGNYSLQLRYPGALFGSAVTGYGIDLLKVRLKEIHDQLQYRQVLIQN